MEGEVSLRLMGVDRQRLPAHPVGALRQRFQTNAHGVTADLGLALVERAPLASVTWTELKAASRFCVKVNETSCGALATVPPTSGLA